MKKPDTVMLPSHVNFIFPGDSNITNGQQVEEQEILQCSRKHNTSPLHYLYLTRNNIQHKEKKSSSKYKDNKERAAQRIANSIVQNFESKSSESIKKSQKLIDTTNPQHMQNSFRIERHRNDFAVDFRPSHSFCGPCGAADAI